MGHRKRIRTQPGGTIRIQRSAIADANSADDDETAESPDTPPNDDDGLQLPEDIVVNFMETRAESQFRPDEDDVETVYALTGETASRVETTHALSSAQVVSHVSPTKVRSNIQTTLTHIERERTATPSVLVQVHTHPHGIPRPSDQDQQTWHQMAETIDETWPDTRVLFGIHAFSREFPHPRARHAPSLMNNVEVEWRSITRDHTVRVFNRHANPVEVTLI